MKNLIKSTLAAFVMSAGLVGASHAADYKFDPSHAQVLFSYNHLGFSTTYGMFSGFEGTASFDEKDLSTASVKVEFKIDDMITGWDKRSGHFKSGDFFNVGKYPVATFVSTSVKTTGEKTAEITGNLTIAGKTKEIVLDAKLNKVGEQPIAKKPWAGFDASTQIKRSDFGLGKFAPYVSDEVDLKISVEMEKLN